METFLQQVAQRIWRENEGRMEHVRVVFNNQRAGVFLKEQMLSLSTKPFFLPTISGIDDLVNELGGLQIVPHEFLLFELFDIHRKLGGVDRRFETFEEFIPFGEMMLGDFAEIDLYMVDAHQLFNNLYDEKRLGEWDISGKPLTPFQEKYLNFYHSLETYYTQLHERLTARQSAYTGMAYRHVAEHIDQLGTKPRFEHIYFVGFNALSRSEATIVSHYVRGGHGTLICDGDSYYVDNDEQEAGRFLRINRQLFSGISDFDEHFAQGGKTIHIVDCPETVLQAKAAGNIVDAIVRDNGDDDEKANPLNSLAIVLADETLLLPMLNSLPPCVDKANVTMGFPYTLSGIHNLADKVMTLFCQSRNGKFYHSDIIRLLSDRLVTALLGKEGIHTEIANKLNAGKTIYASSQELTDMLKACGASDRLDFLFATTVTDAHDLLLLLRHLEQVVYNSGLIADDKKESEALASLVQTVNYLTELNRRYDILNHCDTLHRIYNRLAQRRSIAFRGEPLRGLQLLGMLETRSLDFSRIIMLSANEGTLPTNHTNNSLIPFALKRAFGIPCYEEKDAIYAYNFFRLLQRCDEAWLLYSSESEATGKGEPSRFIMQIKDELVEKYSNIKIVNHVVVAEDISKTASAMPAATSQRKTPRVMARLREMALKGFSPSALNVYRSCPLSFYYTKVLNIDNGDEMSDKLESNEFGDLIHSVLCKLYKPMMDQELTSAMLDEAKTRIDPLLEETFVNDILKGRDPEGKNTLSKEAARMQIAKFLEKEKSFIGSGEGHHTIVAKHLEHRMEKSITTDRGETVIIGGIADRIDMVDGTLRIADYKTGSVKKKELENDATADTYREASDKWFQVMAYAWLYCRATGYDRAFAPGIIPLRYFSSYFLNASWNDEETMTQSHIDDFELMLKAMINDLMNPEIDFFASPRDKDSCTYCPFIMSCAESTKNK